MGGRPTSPLSVFTCIDMNIPAGGGDRSGLPSAFYTDEITLCVSLHLLFSPGGCLRILSASAQIVALENSHPASCGPWSLGHDGHELLSFFTVTHSAEKKIPNQTSLRGGQRFSGVDASKGSLPAERGGHVLHSNSCSLAGEREASEVAGPGEPHASRRCLISVCGGQRREK